MTKKSKDQDKQKEKPKEISINFEWFHADPESILKVRLVTFEPLLGTNSDDPKINTKFVLSKNLDSLPLDEKEAIEAMQKQAEVETGIEEDKERPSTVFMKENGKPYIWNYWIKGFFKSACLAMIESDKIQKEILTKLRITKFMYKRTIDKQIFIYPRKLFINYEGETTWTVRPLRCSTMKGERVTLARSQTINPPASIEFEIHMLNNKLRPFVESWLTYGASSGLGQWHTGGMGSFNWETI